MSLPKQEIDLSDQTFRRIIDFIYQNSGLRFDDSSKFMLNRRLIPRVRELNLDNFEKYYYYLLYHPNREAELEIIFDLLTVNETYFFREDRQLKAFSEEIIPCITQQKQNSSLRIWSAGCSTGEEAYTIAILCNSSPNLKGWDVDIFASDISQKVIQTARKGIFSDSSFRSTPDEIREKYFEKISNNKYRLHDEIRQMVTFGKVNLLDEHKTGIFNDMDIIFCRNVIIYFDTEAKKKVIENFYRKLKKNGYLLLGHAESLLSLTTKFKLTHLKHDMVYQK
ncbi:MAG TPA: protein-glutamate O-methyltransferase CheR [Acidobacteriota bacterium]|jgi:chemotaxis protein methyltransferase CheR|nr:protein-glutamate O-methyltransferase CheR [Acidobacteriota bacterium]